MKGLEVSRMFFSEWVLPFLDREIAGLRDHVAAGRFSGSDALGMDDLLSQDHGWGPTVELYLDDDYDIETDSLADRINAAAPPDFRGFRRRGGYDSAVRLFRIQAYIRRIFRRIPEGPRDWICCGSRLEEIESELYFLRHGSLFHDGSGQFTALRERYRSYPDDIWRLRLASCFYDIAHYGEYNFVWRLVERDDVVAMQIALGHFSKAVMRLHFYLDHDFAPYWKWLPFEFRRRGYSPSINEQLEALPRLRPADQSSAIQSISKQLRQRLLTDGVFATEPPNPFGVPWFFMFRDEILKGISDPEVRSLAY